MGRAGGKKTLQLQSSRTGDTILPGAEEEEVLYTSWKKIHRKGVFSRILIFQAQVLVSEIRWMDGLRCKYKSIESRTLIGSKNPEIGSRSRNGSLRVALCSTKPCPSKAEEPQRLDVEAEVGGGWGFCLVTFKATFKCGWMGFLQMFVGNFQQTWGDSIGMGVYLYHHSGFVGWTSPS